MVAKNEHRVSIADFFGETPDLYYISLSNNTGITRTVTLFDVGVSLTEGSGNSPINIANSVAMAGVPRASVYNPNNNQIYISRGIASVLVVDADTLAITATIPISGGGSTSIAINEALNKVYVENSGAGIDVIDASTNTVIATVVIAGTIAMTFNPNNNSIYVTRGVLALVTIIDCTTDLVTASIATAVGASPTGIDFDSQHDRVYVSDSLTDTVIVIDCVTNTILTTIALPVGSTTAGVAVNPFNSKAYITTQANNTIIVVDTNSNTISSTLPITVSPLGINYNSLTNTVYVTTTSLIYVIDGATDATVNTLAAPIANSAFNPFAIDITNNRVFFGKGFTYYSLQSDVTIPDSSSNYSEFVESMTGNSYQITAFSILSQTAPQANLPLFVNKYDANGNRMQHDEVPRLSPYQSQFMTLPITPTNVVLDKFTTLTYDILPNERISMYYYYNKVNIWNMNKKIQMFEQGIYKTDLGKIGISNNI